MTTLRVKTRWFILLYEQVNMGTYRNALTCYNMEMHKAKQFLWRKFCQEAENVPERLDSCKLWQKL
jgi:hypothetical protein